MALEWGQGWSLSGAKDGAKSDLSQTYAMLEA